MTETCGYRWYDQHSTRDPAGYCNEPVCEGSNYCPEHTELEDDQ